ncbi:conjugal transfer protein TraD [Shigella sonnei]|nr:conjugal transfer protein TraD [Shigella sonnei]
MKPEEEMEQQLPPGISESGEVVDMAAYEAWQQENHPDTWQQMQRREEVTLFASLCGYVLCISIVGLMPGYVKGIYVYDEYRAGQIGRKCR